MPNHELPSDFDPDEEQNLSAEQLIRRHKQFEHKRNLGGFGEEIAQCTRLAQTLVRTGGLTAESLGQIFARAHKSIPMASTYLIAFRAIEEACRIGNLGEILQVVEEAVMADVDPLWTAIGMQEAHNRRIMQDLYTNSHLFELMLPYISPEEDETESRNDGDIE